MFDFIFLTTLDSKMGIAKNRNRNDKIQTIPNPRGSVEMLNINFCIMW